MRVGDGNESDNKQFIKAMKDFKGQLKWDSLIVLDSAFYSQENIQNANNLKWLSRVPLRVKAAQDLVREINTEDLKDSDRPGYRYIELKNTYGGIEQRWLLVESETRRESDLKALAKKIKKDATDARQKAI